MSKPVASPATRALARSHGVDLAALAAALGRDSLTRDDVLAKAGAAAAATVPAAVGGAAPDHTAYWQVDHAQYGPVTEEPLSRFGQVAARNLTAAHQAIPAVTHHDRADMRAVEALRQSLTDEAAARGVKLTALAFQVKALALALGEFPRFNASLSSDGKRLTLKRYVHIGIAVETPHGLTVPVLRDADRQGVWEIAAAIADLAGRAQAQKVRPEESGGASISITNLGGIGGTGFTPLVNPPELAILGIARTETVPVWDGAAFQPVPMAPLALSYDHRAINGADAARFLARHAALIADPRRMLL